LGKTREKLIKRAQDLGSETVEKARQNFEEVKGEVKETLSKTEEKSSQQGAKDKPASSQETGRKVL
jgi:predicted RNase H-like HicB family nuclease